VNSALDLPSHAFGIAHLNLEDNNVTPATFSALSREYEEYRHASNPLYRQGNDPIGRPTTNPRHASDLPIVMPATLYRQTSDGNSPQIGAQLDSPLPETLLKLSIIKHLNAAGRQRAGKWARLPIGLKGGDSKQLRNLEQPPARLLAS